MSLQEKLHQLYLLDQQVRGLSAGLDAARRRLAAQQRKLDQLRQQHRELEDQCKHTGAHCATLEKEAAEMDRRIAGQRDKMNTVTSNKEYSALLVEVNTLKLEKGKKEDEALLEMERRDRMQADLEALAQRVADQERMVRGAEDEVQERQAEVGQRLGEVTAQRDAAQNEVPPAALARFDRAADAHDGEAMADVIEEDRRRMEYACGGCFTHLPVERINTLMTRTDEIVSCPSCGRILNVGKELRAALVRA